MKEQNIALKLVFGGVIFLFSAAFAYFAASYLQQEDVFNYWLVLFIFAVAYIIVGILVSSVFSVSLGLLFTADLLVLHNLFENFGDIDKLSRILIVGAILAVLYAVAWKVLDRGTSPGPNTSSIPQ